MDRQNSDTGRFLSTGVPGLDTILGRGLTSDRLFLIEGEPGTGMTMLALQFLHEGVRRGESVIYITLAKTRVELKAVAQSHGWSMDGIHVEDIIPNEDILHPDHQRLRGGPPDSPPARVRRGPDDRPDRLGPKRCAATDH